MDDGPIQLFEKVGDELTQEQHQTLFVARMMLVPPRALLEHRFEDLVECPYGLTWQEVYDAIHEAPAVHITPEMQAAGEFESAADAARRLWGPGGQLYAEKPHRPARPEPTPISQYVHDYWARRGLRSFEEFQDFIAYRFDNLGPPPDGHTWYTFRKEFATYTSDGDENAVDLIDRVVTETFDGLFGKDSGRI